MEWVVYDVPLSETMLSILSSDRGTDYLKRLSASEEEETRITVKDGCLIVKTKDEDHRDNILQNLKRILDYKDETRPDVKITENDLIICQSELEEKLLVKVSWSESRREVYVKGIRDDVLKSRAHIKNFIERCRTRIVKIEGNKATLFKRYFCQDITSILSELGTPFFVCSEDDIEVKFKGNQEQIDKALQRLKELDDRVTIHHWNVDNEFHNPEDLALIKRNLTPAAVDEIAKLFKEENGCLIITDQPVRYPPCFTFGLSSTCQLIVKESKRSIVKECADALVCVMTQPSCAITRVGYAFVKVCPFFMDRLHSERKKYPAGTVHMIPGPFQTHLKCSAIICVTLGQWNEHNSENQLRDAVENVIIKATSLNAKSIAFPPLGFGQLLKFPPSGMARAMFMGLKKGIPQSTLQKVVILAPEHIISDEFKREIANDFQTAVTQVPVAVDPGDMSIPFPSLEEESSSLYASMDSWDDIDEILSINPPQSSPFQMKIIAVDGAVKNFVTSAINNTISDQYLYTEHFTQELLDSWPDEAKRKISAEAKRLSVVANLSVNPNTGKPDYKVKGERDAVAKMMKSIIVEFHKLSAKIPVKRILSSKTPARNTLQFIEHAASCNEPHPSYWNIQRSFSHRGMMKSIEIRSEKAITDLVQKTFHETRVGIVTDGAGLTHTSIKVLNVKRFQNVTMFKEYAAQRKRLFQKMCREKCLCQDIGKLQGSRGEVALTALLPDFLKEELYHEVNEHYLFYGTPSETVDDMLRTGLSLKVPDHYPMCGKGIYFGECSVKADQYTGIVLRCFK